MADLVRAQIVTIKDPSGRGRVKLSSPFWGAGVQMWAEALRQGGGAAAAYLAGDTVIVGFEGGDPTRPIVLGALPRPHP